MKHNFLSKIRMAMEVQRDFRHPNAYGLDPYLIQDDKKHPVAIICPGGGYGMVCSYVEGRPIAKKLNQLGIHAVIVYYRVREKALYPAPLEDLAQAVREVHQKADEWNLDVDHYSVWGSSAGGHLVASFGTERMGYSNYSLPKPGALILTYPVITMSQHTHQGTHDHFLGKNPTAEAEEMASVEKQITPSYPPAFLWCGDADTCVPPINSHMMAAALQDHGVPYEFAEYPGVDHGVGLGEGLACEDWFDRAVSFWQAQNVK